MPSPALASRLLPFILLGAGLLTACGGEDSATLLADARAKLAAGDDKAAMIQLKNAVAADEKNAEARFELGQLYLAQLDLASAEKEFRRAREAGFKAATVNPLIARALLGQGEFQRLLDEVPAPAEAAADADAVTLQALRATAELGLGHREDARKILQPLQETAPDNADLRLALAQLALVDGDAELALTHLDTALRSDPGHLDALMLKGDLLRATGKRAEAAQVYRDALRIAPRRNRARLALADLAIADNKLADARKEVDAALKITPNDLQARYTQAQIDFHEKKTEQARDHLAQVLKVAPNFIPALQLGGAIDYALGNLQSAETRLNKVAKAQPGNLYALRLLAATQLRLGRPEEATRTLAPALKSARPDAGVLVVAGEIALAGKDFPRATGYFEQAAKLSPDSAAIRTELGLARLAQGEAGAMNDLQAAAAMAGSGSRADTLIILNQLHNKQFDAALASIAALEKKQAASPQSWNYRGAAYQGKQDFAHARESFGQALKLDPAFYPAAANLARLDLIDKQPAAARQRFEGILKADPKNLGAMLALANLSLRDRNEKAYVDWLEKAATAHPQAIEPRVALARHLLAKGDKSKALAVAREAVNAQPDNPAALDLLGTTQLALGDSANAIGSFRKLVELQPERSAVQVKLAAAHMLAKDAASARKTLQDVLRRHPDFLEAQLMLGSLDIQAARFDDAQKIALQIQQQKPTSPAGYTLAGDIALARKDYAAALAAYEQAHQRAPSSTLLLRQMHALKASGRTEEIEKRLLAWLATHPQDAGIRAALAESLLVRGQHKAAAEQYWLLNKSAPDNLLVLNNLAWALLESKDSRALAIAEQAHKLKPDNPAVMDTLGWILVQQGQAARGIKLLQQSLSKVPDAAEIHYHLAAAYAKIGNTTQARQELRRLLGSGRDFPQKNQAAALLQQLGG